jgi:hypothetical protein
MMWPDTSHTSVPAFPARSLPIERAVENFFAAAFLFVAHCARLAGEEVRGAAA